MESSAAEEVRAGRLISIPSFADHRGSLAVIDWQDLLPYEPKRLYYIYGASPGVRRAGHAHQLEHEALVAIHGSFTVRVDNGRSAAEYRLDQPNQALHIPTLVWHELYDFSSDAVCLVLSSERYNPNDYLVEYEQFLQARQQLKI